MPLSKSCWPSSLGKIDCGGEEKASNSLSGIISLSTASSSVKMVIYLSINTLVCSNSNSYITLQESAE